MNESKVLLSIVDELIHHHQQTLNSLTKLRTSLISKEEVEAEKPSVEEKTYTKEDVRAILSEKSAAGFGKEVKALLLKYGADKLSTLLEESYHQVVIEAKEIGNA